MSSIDLSRIRAVGFDLDGTLFDHRGCANQGIIDFSALMGWEIPVADELAAREWHRVEDLYWGQHERHEIDFHQQRTYRMRDFMAFIGVGLADGQHYEQLFIDYLDSYRALWAPFDDLEPLLVRLDELGLPFGILTNGRTDQQLGKLEAMGLLERFPTMVASSDLPHAKPHPSAFETLAARLDVACEELLFIGDDLHKDALGAVGAGATAIWISEATDEVPGLWRVRRLAEITAAL